MTDEFQIQLTDKQRAVAQKYDLTPKFVQFLDRHLVYPLIDNLDLTHDTKEVEQWEYELLKDTYMTKFIEEKWQALHKGEKLPEEFAKKQKWVDEQFETLQESTGKTLEILSSKEVQQNLKQDKAYNREYLAKSHGVDDAKIKELYTFGKFQYDRGHYVMASDLLNNFRLLSTNQELNFSATWGKLAAEIISFSWTEAINEFNKLREVIDSRNYQGSTLGQLNRRAWLIHHSLFVFFRGNYGKDKDDKEPAKEVKGSTFYDMADLFLSSSYMSTIQASCPWILRYLIVAVLYTKQYKKLRDIARAVDVERYEFEDPFTQLVLALKVTSDFEAVPALIEQIGVLVSTDFFLSSLDANKLMLNIQEVVFDGVSKIYTGVSKEYLARLFFEDVPAVDAFLEANADKIVVENGTISARRQQQQPVYHQIYEKTKAFNFKTNQILQTAYGKE